MASSVGTTSSPQAEVAGVPMTPLRLYCLTFYLDDPNEDREAARRDWVAKMPMMFYCFCRMRSEENVMKGFMAYYKTMMQCMSQFRTEDSNGGGTGENANTMPGPPGLMDDPEDGMERDWEARMPSIIGEFRGMTPDQMKEFKADYDGIMECFRQFPGELPDDFLSWLPGCGTGGNANTVA